MKQANKTAEPFRIDLTVRRVGHLPVAKLKVDERRPYLGTNRVVSKQQQRLEWQFLLVE